MKGKIILLWLLSIATWCSSSAFELGEETLNYNVTYKWGLINKNAGSAVIKVKRHGSKYRVELCARSASWADRIYRVRDTLISEMDATARPHLYEKRAHEDGKYTQDIIKYTYNGNNVDGSCTRHRIKDGKTTTETTELTASLPVSDMLNIYYYIRHINFQSMKTGDSVTINMFSGKRKELLRLTYTGITEIKIDKRTYSCYGISFSFTSDGMKKSSDSMTGWITTDARRIPIRITGTLPIGKIHVLYSD